MHRYLLTSLLLAAILLTGCRGMESDREPILPGLSMDYQEKFGPQQPNPFFEDGLAARTPPRGTVAQGQLREDTRFYEGTNQGEYVESIPIPVTREILERGRERYNIHCNVCHGRTGDGEGVIMREDYGYTPAPTFHSSRLREEPDGYMYDVVTNGVRSMPGYGHQIAVADRWAIVAYMRALQRTQDARDGDVPPELAASIEQDFIEALAEGDSERE